MIMRPSFTSPTPGLLATLATMLLLCSTALAQTGRVTIDVDRHIASVGQPIQVTVSIVVEGRGGYEQFIPPSFGDGFQVQGGGMTTQNIEIINWQVRRRESHTYTVVPLRAGALAVGPAAITIQGRRITSGRVTIQVRGGTQPPGPTRPGDEPDARVEADPGFPVQRANERVFLAAVASPAKGYLGQQVVVTWYLFTQSDVLGFQATKQPTTDNFWSEDLRFPRRLVFDRRVLGNRTFYTAVVARKALFPQRTGTLEIGPIGAQVRTLDQFTSSAEELLSEATRVEVMPLPTEGQPAGFFEANVGRFDIAASLDHARVNAGDGLTLKLVVSGSGNLRQVKPGPLEALDGFKVYKPTFDERLVLEDGVSGEKVISYLLMPTRSGPLRVPPLNLDYFDPEAGRYRRASTRPIPLTVTGTMPVVGPAAGDPGTKNVLNQTIRPPRPAGHLSHRPHHTPPYLRWLFVVLATLPAGFLLSWIAGERIRARLRQETAGSLRRAAGRRAQGHLKRAMERMREGDVREFHAQVAAGLRSVLDHRLSLSSEGLTRPELLQRMRQAGLSDDLTSALEQELERCDAARFAPSTMDPQQLEQSLVRVRTLMNRLSRAHLNRVAS